MFSLSDCWTVVAVTPSQGFDQTQWHNQSCSWSSEDLPKPSWVTSGSVPGPHHCYRLSEAGWEGEKWNTFIIFHMFTMLNPSGRYKRLHNVIQALPFNAARTAWFNRSEAILLSGASIRTKYWQNMHKMPSVNLSLSKIYYSTVINSERQILF